LPPQYTTTSEVAKFHLPLGSRDMTPSSSRKASSNIVVRSTKEGTKGGKRRRKQHPQGAMTTINYEDGNNGKADGSSMGHVAIVAHSDKCQARPLTDHFKRLLIEVCPNHAYPIRPKLKDCDMMKTFMISGSPTQGTKLDEDPGRSDTMPFPTKNAVMMVYRGWPPPGRRRMSKLSPGPPTHCGWGRGGTGV
jgi:hypothetical protein